MKLVEIVTPRKLVKDVKTGEMYDPDEKMDELVWKNPEAVAQFKRMKAEQGKGWPKSKSHSEEDCEMAK